MVGRLERRKDMIQVGVESAATHLGRVAGIVTTAVGAVAREVGDFASEMFEMAEASRLAEADERELRALSRAADAPDEGRQLEQG